MGNDVVSFPPDIIIEGYPHPSFTCQDVRNDYWQNIWSVRAKYRSENPKSLTIKTMARTRLKVWDKTNGLCFYCGCDLRPFKDSPKSQGSVFVIEHYIAAKNGGRGNIANLFPACQSCNISKGYKTISDWRFKLNRRLKFLDGFWAENNGWKFNENQAVKL